MKIKSFTTLAKYYDIINIKKNYKKECCFFEKIFKINNVSVKNILDLGCGTGNHDIILAKKGYNVVGVDNSKEMLEIAKKKTKKKKVSVFFYLQEIQNLKLNKKFDCVICMFTLLNYFLTKKSIIQIFRFVDDVLKEDGVFIFDMANPNFYLRTYRPLIRIAKSKNIKIIRIIRLENFLDSLKSKLNISYIIHEKNKVLREFETIVLKYYTIKEITKLLLSTGLKTANVYGDFSLNEKFEEEKSKKMIVVCKKTVANL